MSQTATSFDAMATVSKMVLESRLQDWAREFGGGRYVSLGYSTGEHVLARLIEFGGFLPGSSAPRGTISMTMADEVEACVRRMAKSWPAHARVLRCDYFCPGMAMDARLDMLRRAGHRMGKATYYIKLESAKLYVAGSL
jgi:hypothetical protein